MTALPPSINFTGNITEGQLKQSFTELRDYLDGLLGSDGSTTTARSTLDAQTYSTSLDALTSTTVSTDTMPYFNSSSSAANTTLTAFARTLLADIDASSALSTLGIKSSNSLQSYTAYTTTGSAPNYIVTLNYDIGASLATNTRLRVKFHSNGAGTVASPDMLQLIDTNNSFTNKAIKYRGAGGTKHKFVPINNALLDLEFDGTDWIVLNPPSPLSSVVSTSVTSYTIDSFQYGTLFDFNASSCTVTLPPTSTVGESWLCVIKAGDSSTIIIDPNASEQIDGTLTTTLPIGGSCLVICDGTNWKTVSRTSTPVSGSTIAITKYTSGTSHTLNAQTTKIDVILVGGGGGGSGYGDGIGGEGGNGGEATFVQNVTVTGGASVTFAIGAGGTGAIYSASGNVGGDTTYSTYTAKGGNGGKGAGTATVAQYPTAGGMGGGAGRKGSDGAFGGLGGAGVSGGGGGGGGGPYTGGTGGAGGNSGGGIGGTGTQGGGGGGAYYGGSGGGTGGNGFVVIIERN
jgi:hypothetical protein